MDSDFLELIRSDVAEFRPARDLHQGIGVKFGSTAGVEVLEIRRLDECGDEAIGGGREGLKKHAIIRASFDEIGRRCRDGEGFQSRAKGRRLLCVRG
jgi:hypothetical protein